MAALRGKDGPKVDNIRGAKMDKKWIAIGGDKVVLIDHGVCWWKSGSQEGKTRWLRSTKLLGDEKMDEKMNGKNRWKKDEKRIKKMDEKNGRKKGIGRGEDKVAWINHAAGRSPQKALHSDWASLDCLGPTPMNGSLMWWRMVKSTQHILEQDSYQPFGLYCVCSSM